MALLSNKQTTISRLFIITALLLLSAGILFGLTGSMQYLKPDLLKEYLSFEKIRPLHVSAVVFWIILAATGSVLAYLQQHTGRELLYPLLAKFQYGVFLIAILLILASYCAGIFGGREYWEFNPVLALPVIAGWIMFLINFVRSTGSFRHQPVYIWMWLTGIIFFLFTFIESYLWVFPYFRNNVINDMTIQWKSYGSMVGSWNMLIYGSSIFLMEKITGNRTASHSLMAFVLYFTGLFNLMFNWGHHIYTLPTYGFIKHISYFVSMTELFIFGRIIFQWRSTVSAARKNFNHTAYRFLIAADAWIFLSLLLAIIMSIPAINVYTHGTHITVAHTMGATIGINSFLLLAFAFDILGSTGRPVMHNKTWFNGAYWLVNISLLVFWLSLIAAGIFKAKWQMSMERIPFGQMMQQLRPWFITIFNSGMLMIAGFLALLYPLVRNQLIPQQQQHKLKNAA